MFNYRTGGELALRSDLEADLLSELAALTQLASQVTPVSIIDF